jgi:magnesium-transporting ATPase (P-type)
VITLALAVAVRQLAGRGALVKRLSAVETLGCADVICTDKTGTLTENRMIPAAAWVPEGRIDLEHSSFQASGDALPAPLRELGRIAASCNNALFNEDGEAVGDPTEIAILKAARTFGADTDHGRREAQRRWQFHFDPELKLMSTVDQLPGSSIAIHTKGAPEAVLSLCSRILGADGHAVALDDAARRRVEAAVNAFAAEGLRVVAFARRELAAD